MVNFQSKGVVVHSSRDITSHMKLYQVNLTKIFHVSSRIFHQSISLELKSYRCAEKTIIVHKCDEIPFVIKSVQYFTAQALYLHTSEKKYIYESLFLWEIYIGAFPM